MTGTDDTDLQGLRIRPAVRAVILDELDRVLLVRFDFPNKGTKWALPGGGVEPGESDHDALTRELAEECGLVAARIGPHVWDRLHIIPFIDGRWDGQRERIYLVRTESFEPTPQMTWEQLNAEYVFDVRWWHLQDLDEQMELGPASLREHLRDLLHHGPPNRPVDVGV